MREGAVTAGEVAVTVGESAVAVGESAVAVGESAVAVGEGLVGFLAMTVISEGHRMTVNQTLHPRP